MLTHTPTTLLKYTLLSVLLFSFTYGTTPSSSVITSYTFPYAAAGLSKQQAAEHLLSRFTYGVSQANIDAAVSMGLEQWFDAQLKGNINDDAVQQKLNQFDALKLSNTQILQQYPRGNAIKKMALDDGSLTKQDLATTDQKALRKLYNDYRIKNGLKEEKELYRQFINQKILLALYSNNQLSQVLTDFWFNHFNVSVTKPDCAQFIPVYERDAIRPHILGNFKDLVMATAKSPAMLLYLDNFSSVGTNDDMELRKEKMLARLNKNTKLDTTITKLRAKGLNENYAREVMELHTLGVDGGYTQQDVTEAARVLTGWTIYPMGDYGGMGQMKKIIERIGEDKLTARGFVHEGDFLFAPNRHDAQPKVVLGVAYNNANYNDGVALLTYLANHKSTAQFISKKLATKFVQDNPPQSIINKMAATYLSTKGDIKQVLITMVSAPEFWNKVALREKTKSPFEYAISSVRSLQANVTMPYVLNTWITKMGQKLYAYQAPTGYPDKATYWINTGSLLNRMNFGIALASKRIPGIQFDLAALNNNHEPESATDALVQYSAILLPQRNIDNTIKRLTPLVQDPTVLTKIDKATSTSTQPADNNMMAIADETNGEMMQNEQPKIKQKKLNKLNGEAIQTSFGDNSMLAQVVGIIIGSPEYQRR